MPVYKVTDPNTGRTLRLTGDQPPTQEELESVFSQFKVEAITPQKQFLEELAQEVGPVESFLIGAGRGLTDIGRAVGLAEEESEIEKQALSELENQRPTSQQIGRITGQAAPFMAPGVAIGAIPSLTGRILAGATLGGAEGAAIESGTGGGDVAQATTIGGLVGGGIEALFPVISRLGSALVAKFAGKAPSSVIDNAGRPTRELQQALSESGLSFDDLQKQAQDMLARQPVNVNPEQAARAAQFEQVGLTPTKAQVTRDAADFQAQQEAAKTSTRVREALEAQEGLIANKFDEAVAGTGGQAVTSGSPVIDNVINRSTRLDNEISDLYQIAKQSAPTAKNVKFNRLSKKLKDLAPQDKITNGLIKAIKGDLQSRGIIDDAFKPTGKVSVETGEEVRKVINSFYDSTTPRGRQLIREFKNALDDDVLISAGKDVFNEARSAKAAFERDLARAKINKFDSRKANLVRDMLENKINPDTFVNDVVKSKKWRSTDLKQLKDYTLTDEAGQAAWRDLKAETLDYIKDRSFSGPVDQQGFQAITRDRLQRAIDSIGTEKLKVIFDANELNFLRDILNVTKLREPVRGTALGKGPSAQAIQSLERRVAEMPVLGTLVDMIDIDSAGRAVIKSRPETRARQVSQLEKIIPGAVVAPTVAITQEDQ